MRQLLGDLVPIPQAPWFTFPILKLYVRNLCVLPFNKELLQRHAPTAKTNIQYRLDLLSWISDNNNFLLPHAVLPLAAPLTQKSFCRPFYLCGLSKRNAFSLVMHCYRKQGVSCCCFTHLEQSATTRHFSTIYLQTLRRRGWSVFVQPQFPVLIHNSCDFVLAA